MIRVSLCFPGCQVPLVVSQLKLQFQLAWASPQGWSPVCKAPHGRGGGAHFCWLPSAAGQLGGDGDGETVNAGVTLDFPTGYGAAGRTTGAAGRTAEAPGGPQQKWVWSLLLPWQPALKPLTQDHTGRGLSTAPPADGERPNRQREGSERPEVRCSSQHPACLLISSVNLGNLFSPSLPQFPYL